jgi:hypothetical protein
MGQRTIRSYYRRTQGNCGREEGVNRKNGLETGSPVNAEQNFLQKRFEVAADFKRKPAFFHLTEAS